MDSSWCGGAKINPQQCTTGVRREWIILPQVINLSWENPAKLTTTKKSDMLFQLDL